MSASTQQRRPCEARRRHCANGCKKCANRTLSFAANWNALSDCCVSPYCDRPKIPHMGPHRLVFNASISNRTQTEPPKMPNAEPLPVPVVCRLPRCSGVGDYQGWGIQGKSLAGNQHRVILTAVEQFYAWM